MTVPAHLIEAERDLELDSVDRGVQRYRELSARQPGDDPATTKLLKKWTTYLVKGISDYQDAAIAKGVPPKSKEYLSILCGIEAEKLAVITLRTIMSMIAMDRTREVQVVDAAIGVAKAVKLQRYLDHMKKQDRDMLKILLSRRKKLNPQAVMFAKRCMSVATIRWSSKTRLMVGTELIKLACECTELFTVLRVKAGRHKTVACVALTEKSRQKLVHLTSMLEVMNPIAVPMVVPPKEWTTDEDGGYWYLSNSLVKKTTAGSCKPSSMLHRAVSLLQNTAWKINPYILDVQHQIWNNGGGMAGIPSKDLLKTPPKPKGFNPKAKRKTRWKNVDPDDMKAWNIEAAKIHTLNNRSIGARFASMFKFSIADKLKRYPALYFPWQVDWRTRAYPLPSFINPQAHDTGRSLIHFAKGEPLGEYGFYWLVRQAANLLGYDKAAISERVRVFGEKATADPTLWVIDPLTNRGWMDLEDPFQFLAVMQEIHEVIKQHGKPRVWTKAGLRNHGHEYLSHVCVSVDGSCNGLQHYSAIGLDSIGGRATNLLPSRTPNDIYEQVATVVRKRVGEDCRTYVDDRTHPCHQWAGRVCRTTVKRAVMTTPYGVTQQGILRQFISDGHVTDMEGPQYRNANYLKKITYEAVSVVVVAARKFMDWLQDVALILAESDRPFVWTTPLGVEISQAYRESNTVRVATALGRLSLYNGNQTNTIRPEKQANSIAPNVVHSLDASHMYLTLLAASQQGIKDFGMVHDSYGCHAGKMEQLNTTLREVFVSMYSTDLFAKIKVDLEKRYSVILPDLPAKGDLDITGVLTSDYFFH